MRSATVVLLACLAVIASGAYMKKGVKYADKDFLDKQKFIFSVFQHVYQDDVFYKKYEAEKKFKFADYYDHFDHVEFVKEFVDYYEHDPVPVGEIFTVFNRHHVLYARALARTFQYAKDWDTFYKTVLWARFHVNKGVFVYSLSSAVVHRPDMHGFILPAIYEIVPYYFFNAETIQKAQHYKMQEFYGFEKTGDFYNIVIPTNYSGVYNNDESFLSYFTEDIGLNAFYYYYNLDYPMWGSGPDGQEFMKDRRGEFYFNLHAQLLARYNLERYSNEMPEIEEFHWEAKHVPGYYPELRYYNGVHFPDRENDYSFFHSDNYYYIEEAKRYVDRIYDAIDMNFALGSDGNKHNFPDYKSTIETLGNMVQGNMDSINRKFYGKLDYLFRKIFNQGVPNKHFHYEIPGALYHYETSIRDPAFFYMYKFLTNFYWHYLDHFTPYTKEELFFDGVKIEGVEMDKLVTYFEQFEADITNAVDVEYFDDKTATEFQKFGRVAAYNGHDFVIKASQHRLNHLPFTFKLNVNSNKAQKATVKVFIGPKYDYYGKQFSWNENRKNFFELDYFLVDLVEGKNVITRNSNDFSWYVNDRTTYYDLYKKLFDATHSDYKFPLDMSEAHCGFPSRLMLPKGRKGGYPFQFFFYVMPFHEPKVKQFTGFDPTISCGVGTGARYLDETPFGFPFDRRIDAKHWFQDNMYFYDTDIYHKSDVDSQGIHY